MLGSIFSRFGFIAFRLGRAAVGASLLVHQGSYKWRGMVEATGAAVLAIVGIQGGPLQWQLPWLITGAVAIVLVSFGLSEMVLQRNADESIHPVIGPLLKILGGTGALMVGAVGGDYIQLAVLQRLEQIAKHSRSGQRSGKSPYIPLFKGGLRGIWISQVQ